mgnify:CR=1 FL=1
MAQRKVTTVLQMLADKKAAAEAAASQAVQEQYAQHTAPVQANTAQNHSAMPEPAQTQSQEPVSFAQLIAAQSMPVTMQQTQTQAQPAQPAQPQPAQHHYDPRAVNPYLDPDVEMPEPEPFDISTLGYADSAPVNPLSGAIHISGVADNVYDQVYL